MTPAKHVTVVTLTSGILNQYLPGLVALDRATVLEFGATYDSVAWGAAEFTLERDDKWELSAAAVDGDQPVGFLVASRFEDNVHIHRLAVAHSHRGHQIGKRIVDATCSVARNLKLRYCTVQTPASNVTARDWYINHGFELCKEAELEWYVTARQVEGYPNGGKLTQPEGDCWVLRLDLADTSVARGRGRP